MSVHLLGKTMGEHIARDHEKDRDHCSAGVNEADDWKLPCGRVLLVLVARVDTGKLNVSPMKDEDNKRCEPSYTIEVLGRVLLLANDR